MTKTDKSVMNYEAIWSARHGGQGKRKQNLVEPGNLKYTTHKILKRCNFPLGWQWEEPYWAENLRKKQIICQLALHVQMSRWRCGQPTPTFVRGNSLMVWDFELGLGRNDDTPHSEGVTLQLEIHKEIFLKSLVCCSTSTHMGPVNGRK